MRYRGLKQKWHANARIPRQYPAICNRDKSYSAWCVVRALPCRSGRKKAYCARTYNRALNGISLAFEHQPGTLQYEGLLDSTRFDPLVLPVGHREREL